MSALSSRSPDVIVAGGGLVGSSIALYLAQAGLRVTVFDRGEPGAEASSAAAGMIAPQGEKAESEAFSDLCWTSHGLYPDFVANVEDLSGQEVGYRRDGTLLVALDDDETSEMAAMAKAAEVAAPNGAKPVSQDKPARRPDSVAERLTREVVRERVPGLGVGKQGGLFLPADHWVDNELLTAAVIEAATRLGVCFRAGTGVERLVVSDGRVPGVVAGGESFSAGEVILAAGCWSRELAASAGVRVPTLPCRGQMMEFELARELPLAVRAGASYLVPRSRRRVIAGTTAEYAGFEKAVTASGLAYILQGGLRLAPLLSEARFSRAWAGLRPDTSDHLPVLGHSGIRGLTVATGHFRNGILLAPVTARLIGELVLTGQIPAALDPFRVDRFALEAAASRA